jgi:epoxyqueuosine reductase
MGWLAVAPERRTDPTKLDSRLVSVVSLGMSYYQPEGDGAVESGSSQAPAPADSPPRRPGSTPTGRLARYARGADYHNVLGRKLRKLMKHLRATEPGLDGRWYVDTGPVMDRAWAARSGVGWWGKHTNLVSRQHGSWLVLGTMLLNRELEYDPPEADFCGTCVRCIEACPTRAITAPRELDARLCISYLTIEHRGPIPRELRAAIADWIFGCDLCLDVCPWNRFAEASRESRFQAREDRERPALLPLLTLSEDEFKRRFNGSPIQRARRDGFVRNVAVALGNVGGPEAIEPLAGVLRDDPSPLVRGHAAWALGRLADRLGGADAEEARAALRGVRDDQDPFVREELAEARQAAAG